MQGASQADTDQMHLIFVAATVIVASYAAKWPGWMVNKLVVAAFALGLVCELVFPALNLNSFTTFL